MSETSKCFGLISLSNGLRRVARCPVFNRTVWYFGSLSGIKMIVIPDDACVNSSIFCATDPVLQSVPYFGGSHLATLDLHSKF